MLCENCHTTHDANYGSGRFCSSKCARGFSTKEKRKLINQKVSDKLKGRIGGASTVTENSIEKTKETWRRKLIDADFDTLKYEARRKRIILEQDNKCNHCGISDWFGKPLSLEIDHINGISDDNRRENLEAICPNCHSVTDTWRGRNKPKRNGTNKVSDEELIAALKNTKTIRQALLFVGLAAKGGNYKRAKDLSQRNR